MKDSVKLCGPNDLAFCRETFFDQDVSVLKVKEPVQRLVRIQIHPEGHRGLLYRPNNTKAPKERRKKN